MSLGDVRSAQISDGGSFEILSDSLFYKLVDIAALQYGEAPQFLLNDRWQLDRHGRRLQWHEDGCKTLPVPACAEPLLMRIPNALYLIIDLEATCSNDGSVPRHEMEIIEIGAVLQNARTFEIESEFQTFVRPVRHPRLTAFCTELTSITQVEVEAAPLFPAALESMKEWMDRFEGALFCSWGDYDRFQFLQDCQHHGVEYPFPSGHLNLKEAFSRTLNTGRRFGVRGALRKLGLDFEGAHHRGIDDARNIARVVRAVAGAA